MSLILAGRLFHSAGAAMAMPMGNCNSSSQKNEAGIYISPLIELDCRYRTAQVDILL